MMQNSVLSVCLIWFLSVIVSICIILKVLFFLVKELADNGYCLDISYICESSNRTNDNGMILLFIPLANIMYAFIILVGYLGQREIFIEGLSVDGFVREMSDFEKRQYEECQSGLLALVMQIDYEARLSKAKTLEVEDSLCNSKIFYEVGRSIDDITILKIEGPVSRLPESEQKDIIKKDLRDKIRKNISRRMVKDIKDNVVRKVSDDIKEENIGNH